MKYFDSHAHYYDERFSEESEKGADGILGTLFSSQVSGVINVGTCPETCRLAAGQARRFEGMYTALGIHPSDSVYIKESVSGSLLEIESMILDKSNKCVALGEIGLDYHYENTDKPLQWKYLEAQLSLAERLALPVVIHDRDAHGDIMSVIKNFPRVKGVFHSFSGSAEMAEELLALGYIISFSGTLTFTNAKRPKEAARVVPIDKILIETDSPYLAPHPLRGTLNHSGNLVYTNRVLAEIKGISEEECALITEENARRFFGL